MTTQTMTKLTTSNLLLLALIPAIAAQTTADKPIDYVNALVGTAPLDQPNLIGNAPPPGEQLYSGFTSPSARLPHSSTELGPINANLDVNYPAGVRAPYFYLNRTMYGFSTGTGESPTLMPVVGDFTIPPERSGSVYEKSREKASAGYYSVYLDDYRTQVEMTATTWTGIFRITFPASDKSNILVDLGREGGDVEIIDNNALRGHTENNRTFFIAEFSQPFQSFGTFKQFPPRGPHNESLIGDDDVHPNDRNITGNFAGAYLRFDTIQGQQVLVKIASGPTYESAEARLHTEQPGFSFDDVHHQADAAKSKAAPPNSANSSTPAFITRSSARNFSRAKAKSSPRITASSRRQTMIATALFPSGTQAAIKSSSSLSSSPIPSSTSFARN